MLIMKGFNPSISLGLDFMSQTKMLLRFLENVVSKHRYCHEGGQSTRPSALVLRHLESPSVYLNSAAGLLSFLSGPPFAQHWHTT